MEQLEQPKNRSLVRRAPPIWVWISPYFISALFFVSFLFSYFAPMPQLLYSLTAKPWQRALALLTNIIVVALLSGWVGAGMFLIYVALPCVFIPHFLIERKKGVDLTTFFTLLAMVVSIGALLGGWSLFSGENPLRQLRDAIFLGIDQLQPMGGKDFLGTDIPPDMLKKTVWAELPSALILIGLFVTWGNQILFLRVAPAAIREKAGVSLDYFKNWKTHELLIWPTILAGAGLLFGKGFVVPVSLNLFRVMMALYLMQGLSVVSYAMDAWGIQGFFRGIFYILLIFLMMPLLLAIGFFDLWFNFREKIRASKAKS